MPTLISVFTRSNYGTVSTYAADPVMRAKLAALTGRQTLTDSDIRALASLGFTFASVPDPKYGSALVSSLVLPASLNA